MNQNRPPGPPYGAPPPAGGFGAPQPGYAPPHAPGYPQPHGYPQQYAPPYGQQQGWHQSEQITGSGGLRTKWVAIGGYAFTVVSLTFIGIVMAATHDNHNESPPSMLMALAPLSMLGLMAYFVGVLIWLYQSWDMLPPSMRYTATRQVSPGQAIGFLFIPFFNWYWIFVANVGYCDALDRMLINQGSHRRAPKGLAIACCVTQLVPYVNILIAPFLWMTYMILADRAKAELLPR